MNDESTEQWSRVDGAPVWVASYKDTWLLEIRHRGKNWECLAVKRSGEPGPKPGAMLGVLEDLEQAQRWARAIADSWDALG